MGPPDLGRRGLRKCTALPSESDGARAPCWRSEGGPTLLSLRGDSPPLGV